MPADRTDLALTRAIVVRALGRRIRVVATGPGAAGFSAALTTAWSALLDEVGSTADEELSVGVPDAGDETIADLMASTTSRITLAAISANIGAGLLFHAAALADGPGSAVLLVGRSGAGKTTAVRHFARHHGYLTDETALVRPDGLVVPYPKPLSLIEREGTAKAQLSPRELGLQPLPGGDLAVTRLVVLDRQPDGSRPASASRLGLAESIIALVPHLSSFTAAPEPLVSLARLIARVGGVERLHYRSVDELDPRTAPPTCPPLRPDELAFTVPAPSADEPVVSSAPSPSPAGSAAEVVRRSPRDAIETPDVLIVALDDTVTAIGGVSQTIWHETARPRSLAAVLESVRRVHGGFDGDEAIVASNVEQLVDHGVLRRLR